MRVSIPKINIKINQYWLIQVDDYHEFDNIRDNYKEIGIKVKYIELDCDKYIGCFYIGRKPTKFIKHAEDYINSGKQD